MITLAFLLDHQVISRSDKNTVVAGSKNYVRARFILRTDDWVRPITAIFGGYTQLLDDNNECTVPWEVLQQPGKVEVSAFCGDLHTANIAVVPVEKTGYKSGETPKDPTPDVYQQFLQAVKGDADRAAQAAADAEAAMQKVTDAGTQAVTDIGNAKDSALEAIDAAREEAAGSISADVEGAKQAAADAEQSAADAEQSAKNAADALANVQAAGQSALDDIATERQNTLSDIQNEGAKQQSAVAGAGTAALEAIGQTEQAAINQVRQAGATQASAVQSAGTTQISQVNSAGAAQVQAVKDEGAAQTSALDDAAAAHKTELEAIASHPPQPNTETGKWQVWNAETGAYQDTDALYQGGYYTASVSNDGTLTWQGSSEGMPELPSVNIKGPKGDKGDPGLGVPSPTQSDAGKVPTVKADGSAYELAGPYAPLSAAIRPTAGGNPVSITDSVEWPLQGLTVYGKSTQNGTPSLENPVPIVSAGDGGSIGLTVSNSADQSQSLTVSTPNGLPGIPVDYGGNYTDVSGQQWVCDEVDFAKGVYVKRANVFKVPSNYAFEFGNGYYNLLDESGGDQYIDNMRSESAVSNTLNTISPKNTIIGNGISGFFYILPNNLTSNFGSLEALNGLVSDGVLELLYPTDIIETPLSEDELAAYRAIHTYDGTAVISTPEDVAGIEVRYVANGEKYIDRKISEAIASAAETKLAAYDTLSGAIHEGVNEA